MQASQCTTTPRAGAIFRQKSGRGFLRFSLSLALFPPFPFFRLSLFSAFPSFPRFFKKQKPLRRRESLYHSNIRQGIGLIWPFIDQNDLRQLTYTRKFSRRNQPDNIVPLCKFQILSLFISLQIDCFHSQ